MQSLFEWEFRGEQNLDQIVDRNIGEFSKDVSHEYVWKVVRGVVENYEAINKLIIEAAPEWPLEQVARIDKNVLRVAIYEMLFDGLLYFFALILILVNLMIKFSQ